MTCLFPFDDGAYVLGALSPAERAEYERHLSTCPSCRESVAQLAVLPGLLSRLDPAMVATIETQASPTRLPRLLAKASKRRRSERRRRRWYSLAASIIAIVLGASVGLGVGMVSASNAPPVLLTSMDSVVGPIPMTAKIGLTKVDDGTEIVMECTYAKGSTLEWPVQLAVYPRTAGAEPEKLGRWIAESDQDWSLRKHTHLLPQQIGRVELQSSDGKPLLIWVPS